MKAVDQLTPHRPAVLNSFFSATVRSCCFSMNLALAAIAADAAFHEAVCQRLPSAVWSRGAARGMRPIAAARLRASPHKQPAAAASRDAGTQQQPGAVVLLAAAPRKKPTAAAPRGTASR